MRLGCSGQEAVLARATASRSGLHRLLLTPRAHRRYQPRLNLGKKPPKQQQQRSPRQR